MYRLEVFKVVEGQMVLIATAYNTDSETLYRTANRLNKVSRVFTIVERLAARDL